MRSLGLCAIAWLALAGTASAQSADIPCFDVPGCSPYYEWLFINLYLENLPDKSNFSGIIKTPDLSESISNMDSYSKCQYARETQNQMLEYCIYEVKSSLSSVGQLFTYATCESTVKYGHCLPSDLSGFLMKDLAQFTRASVRADYLKRCPSSNVSNTETKMLELGEAVTALLATPLAGLLGLAVDRHCGEHEQSLDDPGTITMILIAVVLMLLGIGSELLEYMAKISSRNVNAKSINGANIYESQDEIPLIATTDITGMAAACNQHSFLRNFNLSNNLSELFSKTEARSLGGLDGLKGFSMLWIILAHASLFSTFLGTTNPAAAKDYIQEADNYFTYSAQFGVDTFFFISGQLTAYVLSAKLKSLKRPPGPKQFVIFIMLRWLRLTPLYAFILFMYTFVASAASQGPFWFKMLEETVQCKQYWWANLLYVNNFVPHEYHDQCMAWSWYLANDLQFYVVALIVMFIYVRNTKAAAALAVIITIASVITGYVIGVQSDFRDDGTAQQNDFYDKPYCRIAPYTAGLLLGMVLRDTKLKKLRLSTAGAFIAMTSCVGAIVFLFYVQATRYNSTFGFNKPLGALKQNWDKYEYAAFNSFGRMAFTLAIAGMCALNASGNGGIVYGFLTLPFWDPLGKLTFGAYLIHPVLLRIYYYSQQDLFNFSHINQTVAFVAAATLGYGFSMISYVLIELPCDSAIKKLLGAGKKK